jgi:hypothetical protein
MVLKAKSQFEWCKGRGGIGTLLFWDLRGSGDSEGTGDEKSIDFCNNYDYNGF